MLILLLRPPALLRTVMKATVNYYNFVAAHPSTAAVKSTLYTGMQITVRWINQGIQEIPRIPARMQENIAIAFGVILAANSIYFFTINKLADFISDRMPEDDMSRLQLWFKHRVIIDCGLVGGSVFLLNRYAIPYVTGYAINNWVSLAISITAYCGREIWKTRNEAHNADLEQQLGVLQEERDALQNLYLLVSMEIIFKLVHKM